MERQLFELGNVVATSGALDAFDRADKKPLYYLSLHVHGNWGELDAEDKATNNMAAKSNCRILSAYTLSTGVKIWIITEWDRSVTTILLPEEY